MHHPRLDVLICAPPGNTSHRAFSEVAEMLHYAAKALGLPSEIKKVADEIELKKESEWSVVLGLNLFVAAKVQLHPTAIVYNLEVLKESNEEKDRSLAFAMNYAPLIASCRNIWDYSPRNIEVLRKMGASNVAYVPMGFVPELKRIREVEDKPIDVLFYGSINERRTAILRDLEMRGVRVQRLFGVWGRDRDEIIAHSKIVLNMHFYEQMVFEEVRVSYLLNNGALVVAEVNEGTALSPDLKGTFVDVPYEQLVPTILRTLEMGPIVQRQMAEEGLRRFAEGRDMAHILKGALDAWVEPKKEASLPKRRAHLRLAMVVKNEDKTIHKTLESVKPFIDSYVILDTGSTDFTVKTILKELEGVEGEVLTDMRFPVDGVEGAFNYAAAKNAALEAAERGVADFILLLDAEDVLVGGQALREAIDAELTLGVTPDERPAYFLTLMVGGGQTPSARVFRNGGGWRYQGEVHEVAGPPGIDAESWSRENRVMKMFAMPDNVAILHERAADSALRTKGRLARDRQILERQMKDKPDSTRAVFLHAQTCADMGDTAVAIEGYIKRASMGGWLEEVYVSLVRAGKLIAAQDPAGTAGAVAVAWFLRAYVVAGQRAEHLYEIALHYLACGENQFALYWGLEAARRPVPTMNELSVNREMYRWGIDHLIDVAAWGAGEFELGERAARRVLACLPDNEEAQKRVALYESSRKETV